MSCQPPRACAPRWRAHPHTRSRATQPHERGDWLANLQRSHSQWPSCWSGDPIDQFCGSTGSERLTFHPSCLHAAGWVAASISRKLWRSPISAALVAIRAPPKKVSPAHRSLRRVFGFDAADLSHHADTEFQISSAISWSSAFGSGSSSTSAIALQTVSVCLHQRPARTPFHGSCDNCALRFGLKDTETFARQATCLHASRYLFLFYSQDALASSLSSIKSIGPSMHTWSSRGRHLVAGAIGIEATRGVARLDGVDGFRKSWRRWHTT